MQFPNIDGLCLSIKIAPVFFPPIDKFLTEKKHALSQADEYYDIIFLARPNDSAYYP